MKRIYFLMLLIPVAILLSNAVSKIALYASIVTITSPDASVVVTVTYSNDGAAVVLNVKSKGVTIIDNSPVGITTDVGDFTSGLTFVNSKKNVVNETYTLPVGKKSTYLNNANEAAITFSKNGHQMVLIVRAYNDGLAYRYSIPGTGNISISSEASAFKLPGTPIYWGQPHPNSTGNETQPGIVNGTNFSLPLLCELKALNCWVLIAQAATYETYCIPYLKIESGFLRMTHPMDQKGAPILTTLPFNSPWRVAVISPDNLSKIVEQTIFENLNPPTEPNLKDAAWIKAGRSSWDYLAGDRKKPMTWIDFDDQMGWEYHLMDAGWERQIGNTDTVVQYAKKKGVGLWGWAYTPSLNTPEKADSFMIRYNSLGLKGAKIDFFDKLPDGARTTDDYEDTQMGIKVRDDLEKAGAKHHILMLFHGAAIPSGERRRWPHLLGTEAVSGMEGTHPVSNDCCIPFIRNTVGPVDYTPVWFGHGNNTNSEMVACAILFETGVIIYSELHSNILASSAKDIMMKIPANWDDVKLIEGYPGSYVTIARRKGDNWFVGTISTTEKTAVIPLSFLNRQFPYNGTIYRDGNSRSEIVVEKSTLRSSDTLKIPIKNNGGASVFLESTAPSQTNPNDFRAPGLSF